MHICTRIPANLMALWRSASRFLIFLFGYPAFLCSYLLNEYEVTFYPAKGLAVEFDGTR